MAMALMAEVSPGGFWFVDDPDDFREIDGMLQEGHGLVIDEVCLAKMNLNHVKKMLDLDQGRRISCRHFNGTIPKGCPRIFCTNSDMDSFYPKFKSKHDRTGVLRRQLFQVVAFDIRLPDGATASQALAAPAPALPVRAESTWQQLLGKTCSEAHVPHCSAQACAAAQNLGVAIWDEVVEVGDQIAQMASMKVLQRRRFLSQLR